MNSLHAQVSSIKSMQNLSIVKFSMQNHTLEMMSLGTQKSVKIGSHVLLGVKATSISLAKDLKGKITTSNQIECIVQSVDNGTLLSSIQLCVGDGFLESVITKDSSLFLDVQKGDKILALIKASDLSILEVKE